MFAGLFTRRRSAEQPGDRARPNNPDLHLIRTADKAMDVIEWTGDDYDDVQARPAPVPAVRAWRLGAGGIDTSGPIGLSTEQGTRANRHLDDGEPDARRVNLLPAPVVPGPEFRHNDRDDVNLTPQAAPTRARQGFTGQDPTRAAQHQVAYLLRPFDQGIAQHPGTVERADQAAPTAARPPERRRLIGGRPSAAGSSGTGMERVGPQRNTVRQTPGKWDEKIVNTGQTAPAAPRSWRAR